MSQVRAKRLAPSVVNTPVTVHIKGSKALSKEETERLLTKFIDNEDQRSNNNLLNNTGANSTTGASVSQLKRIQRDLRGLPPLETSSATTPSASSNIISTKATPKKTKFEDFDEPVAKPETQETQESIPEPADDDVEVLDAPEDEPEEKSEKSKISKEERKRLKKEKKKAEKRAKTEK